MTTTDAGAIPVFPPLTPEQFAILARYGERASVSAGDVLYSAGDPDYDFIAVESGEVEVVRPAMPGAPEAAIVSWGPGYFLGELNLITGQSAVATTRMREPESAGYGMTWLTMAMRTLSAPRGRRARRASRRRHPGPARRGAGPGKPGPPPRRPG